MVTSDAEEETAAEDTVAETPGGRIREELPDLPSRYRVIGKLGRGGMGTVYRAVDGVLDREVAVKAIRTASLPEGTLRQRLLREARAAARLEHPSIVAVHDVDPEGRYVVMELVRGEPLAKQIARGPLAVARVRAIALPILSALEAAHAAGIVHRDIKPSNVMIADDGKPVLVDFGIAHLADAEMTRTGEYVGTPAYMAPEQLRGGKVDARADLYSLGATLYVALVGKRIESVGEMTDVERKLVRRAAREDRALAYVVGRCLEPDPARRFPSAAAAREALGKRPPPSRRAVAIGLALIIPLAAAAITVALTDSSTDGAQLDEAWQLSQRGHYEAARDRLERYLGANPDDPDALLLAVLIEWWTAGDESFNAAVERATSVELDGPAHSLVSTLRLIREGRHEPAIAYATDAVRRHPDDPGLLYALGEAFWHGQHLERGANALRRSFESDPAWQMSLHHVEQLYLSQLRLDELAAIARRLERSDRVAGASLRAKIAIARGDYAAAGTLARSTLDGEPESVAAWTRLGESLVLQRRYDDAEHAFRQAFERSPVDDRNWGPLSRWAEIAMYRNDPDTYAERMRGTLQLTVDLEKILAGREPEPKVQNVYVRGFRSPPLWTAIVMLHTRALGHDYSGLYLDNPDPELAAFGEGLAAIDRGDLAGASRRLERALDVPSDGTTRMLIAHRLALVEHELGHHERAADACEEVVRPRVYEAYRALLLRDCVELSR